MANSPLGFPFGFYVADNSPIDGKYGIISAGVWRPYNDVAEALAVLPVGARHIGLTVNITNVEYWWEQGDTDVDLVIKGGGSIGGSTGAIDNAILRADGTGGTTLQNSSIIANDNGDLTLGVSSLGGGARVINVDGSEPNIHLFIHSKGTGGITLFDDAFNPFFHTSRLQFQGMYTSEAYLRLQSAFTNTVGNVLKLTHWTSGTPAIGIGAGLQFEAETSTSNYEIGATIEAVTTEVMPGSENFDLIIKTMLNGTTAAERVRINDRGLGIGLTPTARLTLAAGAGNPYSAPLKFTSGTAMVIPEDGALEYHSSHLYFTIGSTRFQLDQQAGAFWPLSGTAALSGTTTIEGANNDLYLGTTGNRLFSLRAHVNDVIEFIASSGVTLLAGSTQLNVGTGGIFMQHVAGGQISISNASTVFTDNKAVKSGILYDAAGYVTNIRSLTDKAYVDAAIAAGGGSGWAVTGTTTLTGITTIDAADFDLNFIVEDGTWTVGHDLIFNGNGGPITEFRVDLFKVVALLAKDGIQIENTDSGNITILNGTSGWTLAHNGSGTFVGKQIFTPAAGGAGINIGTFAGTPGGLADGDMWIDTTGSDSLKFRKGTVVQDIVHLVGGAAVSARVPFFAGTTGQITSDADLTWDATNNAITIGDIRIHSTGFENTFVGNGAGPFTLTGVANTVFGSQAGFFLTTGSGNVLLGQQAGGIITTGGGNLLLGFSAGLNLTTGSGNVIVGGSLSAQSATGSNQLSIQNIIFGTDNSATGTTVSTGNIGIGVALPNARLHLPAGSASANTAPLKLTSGTALTTPENGALEYHSSHLYFTIGSTRHQLDQQAGSTIASGTYTPTITPTANVGSSTASQCQYMRVGNVVTVSGSVSILATVVGGNTVIFNLSLPVPASFTNSSNCGGMGAITAPNESQDDMSVIANTSSNTAEFRYASISSSALTISFTFTYLIS